MNMIIRTFSPQARAAAQVARIKAAARNAMITNAYEVFVTKGPSGAKGYTWEIRKFGGLTVQDTKECYSSMALARGAGEAALIAWNG